ncbi:MAG: hypothetical protein RLZZ165_2109 [Bacteroidota bacterium]|jgi:cyclopropane fatty-acyl-phospholipid synthase-like methyltransferase
MNWIRSIRDRYSVSVFQQQAKKLNFPHTFVDLERATSIGFIVNTGRWNADDLVYFTRYITHLEDRGKKVVVVEISYHRKSKPMFRDSTQSVFINPRQMNWFQLPSIARIQELNAANLEILLNLDSSEKLASRFVCGLSSAKTRVGLFKQGHEAYYELMLQLPFESKLPKILSAFEQYSKMLEK